MMMMMMMNLVWPFVHASVLCALSTSESCCLVNPVINNPAAADALTVASSDISSDRAVVIVAAVVMVVVVCMHANCSAVQLESLHKQQMHLSRAELWRQC